MKSEAPHIAYHPGSPWGDGIKTSDPTIGDMHQWNGNLIHMLLETLMSFSLAWNPGKIPDLRYLGRAFQQRVWHGSISSHQHDSRVLHRKIAVIPAIKHAGLSQQG
jgi:hypothetical protein